jgi:hypothetical protein
MADTSQYTDSTPIFKRGQTANGRGALKDAQAIQRELIAEGWFTPNTYGNCFRPITDGSAVYLFLMYRHGCFDKALVAYVGMSKKLSQRLSGHPVFSEIDTPERWVMQWFKPVQPQDLRKTEAHYITKFDPPWNIIGRPRGVALI